MPTHAPDTIPDWAKYILDALPPGLAIVPFVHVDTAASPPVMIATAYYRLTTSLGALCGTISQLVPPAKISITTTLRDLEETLRQFLQRAILEGGAASPVVLPGPAMDQTQTVVVSPDQIRAVNAAAPAPAAPAAPPAKPRGRPPGPAKAAPAAPPPAKATDDDGRPLEDRSSEQPPEPAPAPPEPRPATVSNSVPVPATTHDPALPGNDPGATVVCYGKMVGKRLADVPRKYTEWYANTMTKHITTHEHRLLTVDEQRLVSAAASLLPSLT